MAKNQDVLTEFRKVQADLERSHGPQASTMLNILGGMLVELCGPGIDNSLPVPPVRPDNALPGRLPPRADNELPQPPRVSKPVPKPEPKKPEPKRGFRR